MPIHKRTRRLFGRIKANRVHPGSIARETVREKRRSERRATMSNRDISNLMDTLARENADFTQRARKLRGRFGEIKIGDLGTEGILISRIKENNKLLEEFVVELEKRRRLERERLETQRLERESLERLRSQREN